MQCGFRLNSFLGFCKISSSSYCLVEMTMGLQRCRPCLRTRFVKTCWVDAILLGFMSVADSMPQLIFMPVVFSNIAGCEVSGMLHHVSLYPLYHLEPVVLLEYNCSFDRYLSSLFSWWLNCGCNKCYSNESPWIEVVPVLNVQHNSIQSLADSCVVRELRYSSLPAYRREGSLDWRLLL